MGYRCITALDISATAIALMQAEEQGKEGIECKCTYSNKQRVCEAPDVCITGYTLPHQIASKAGAAIL